MGFSLPTWVGVETTLWVEETFTPADTLGTALFSVWVGDPPVVPGCGITTTGWITTVHRSLGTWKITISRSERSVTDWKVVLLEQVDLTETTSLGFTFSSWISRSGEGIVVIVVTVDHVLLWNESTGV